jgi:[glutamine synthetase] adenylyltransferase / [glutamine synthetase]-adenylyl-L-tyrosine phosphorylase
MHMAIHSAEEIIESVLPFSRYAQRLLTSEPGLRTELLQNLRLPFLREEMQASLDVSYGNATDEVTLNKALRDLRKRVMLRLIVRDLSRMADLVEVMTSMTHLAEITISFALERHQDWLSDTARYGSPRGSESGAVQNMLVVAMGKLGGGELNVSSDVDLIFVYPEDGETDGVRRISNHDFFARLGRKLIASLHEITADGFVFRVDMRLRPYGDSGPLAMSFVMLEKYLITQGREWERYAWIKSRIIAAGSSVEESKLMQQVARPFIYRKYLDFGAYESMRGLHSQIRKEVSRREIHDDIKLGPGGIREIEFIAQVFQLVRGGRDADLRVRPTLAVLQCLREKKQLPNETVMELVDAYHFLRNLEHRLQYLDDQQTHMLPSISADQELISASMGSPSYIVFLQSLDTHRRNVTRHFELVFAAPQESQNRDTLAWLWQEHSGDESETKAATDQLAAIGFSDPTTVLFRLQEFRRSGRYRQLSESSRKRVDSLVPAIIEVAAKFSPADHTLERMLQLLESVSRRAAYLALLLEFPQALERIAKLANTSQWASEYLGRHSILLDELLNPADLNNIPDWPKVRTELAQQLNEANQLGDDIEQQMDVLRHFQHAQVFQLLVRDLEGLLPLETLSDHLTELADLVLDTVLNLAWSGLRRKHRDLPVFAIIGYGKLGGKELGYASDLDIIFLYNDSHPDAPEIYARLAQRINSWLTSYTSAGLLYEADLRLRPNGSSGLLVSSIEAFEEYQRNQAWMWEHQALTRARFVVGDCRVGEAFESLRKEVLCQRRDLENLKHEVLLMRQKMLDTHPNSSGLFDIKHDRGGIIDVEFMVQYLVLGHACEHPELTANIGNIALLKLAGKLDLIPVQLAEQVLNAYREFRRVQHRLRLSGDSVSTGAASMSDKLQKFARVDADELSDARAAVLGLWEEIFGV